MQLDPLTEARLLRRYKRFLADVEFPGGEIVTVHCPNTGAMTGCAEPGTRVWLQHHDNPKRKYCWTWVLAESHAGDLIWIYSAKANDFVAEAIQAGVIDELNGYPAMRREYSLATGERIDFLLSDEGSRCLVEAKAVTLLTESGGQFPDTVSKRAARHLDSLVRVVEQGDRAVLLFVCLHAGIDSVSPAVHIDPHYASRLAEAAQAGVEILAYRAAISTSAVSMTHRVPVIPSVAKR